MGRISSFLIPLLIATLSILAYREHKGHAQWREVLTVPYSELSDDEFDALDHLAVDGYDPRRAGIAVLDYISSNCDNGCKIPLGWIDVVHYRNKTLEGQLFLQQSTIRKVILMRETLREYDVAFDLDPAPIKYNVSISGRVRDFFKDEVKCTNDFKAIELTTGDFNASGYLDRIRMMQNQEDRDNLLSIYGQEGVEETKYYKEGSLIHNKTVGIQGLSHYDLRFYHTKLSEMDRIAILHRISRAWASFSRQLELKTWIMHGSLMGYYFNGLIMPWDDDLDVQITLSSFWKLLEYNSTLVIDYQDEMNLGKYFVDTNPWVFKRDSYKPENKIDARFIDVDSGLYIDITVLTINENIKSLNDLDSIGLNERQMMEVSKVFEPIMDEIVTETKVLHREVSHAINQSLINQDSLVSCKDFHYYKIQELSPLIPTIFEGEVVLVPNNIGKLLLREYHRRSLYLEDYGRFHFDKLQNLWISKHLDYENNSQLAHFVSLHYQLKQATMKRHIFHSKFLQRTPPFRVEPWIRQQALLDS